MKLFSANVLLAGIIVGAGCFFLVGRADLVRASGGDHGQSANQLAKITVDYPEDGSIFPPEITPPTFLWRDSGKAAAYWKIEITFGDSGAAIHATSKGERLRIGWIDPDGVAASNEPPRLTPELAAAHSWT